MKQFTLSELHRQTGEISEVAITEPVAITKHGKEKFFMVPAEQYNRLMGRAGGKSYSLLDAPDEVHDELMSGITAILSNPQSNV